MYAPIVQHLWKCMLRTYAHFHEKVYKAQEEGAQGRSEQERRSDAHA